MAADADAAARAGPGAAFAGGCLAGFAVSWNLANTGAIAPTLGRHYGVGLVVVGLLTSVAFLAELAVMVPGGRAIDRFGARRVSLLSLVLCLAGNLLLLVAPGIEAALALRFAIGFGVGAGFVAGSVWITADPLGRSPLGQGLFGGVSLSGAGVATAAVPLLEGALGWRASYLTAAAVAAAALGAGLATPGLEARPDPPQATPLRSLVGNPLIVRLGAMHSASFAFSVVLGNWVVTLLRRHLQLSYGTAGVAGALVLALGIVGRPLGGWAMRRVPERRYEVLVASLAIASLAAATLAAAGSLPLAAAACALLGLASGLPFGAAVAGAAASFPRAPGEAIGAMNLYAVATIIAGVPLVGATFALPGEGRIGFALLAALAAAAIVAVPRPLFRRDA